MTIELTKENVRFRIDSSKARYALMCDIYFKNADTLNALLNRALKNINIMQEKILESEKTVYPFMLMSEAIEIIKQNSGTSDYIAPKASIEFVHCSH